MALGLELREESVAHGTVDAVDEVPTAAPGCVCVALSPVFDPLKSSSSIYKQIALMK